MEPQKMLNLRFEETEKNKKREREQKKKEKERVAKQLNNYTHSAF